MSKERLLLAIDLVLARVEVGLVGLDALGLHEELVAEDADEVDGNALKTVLDGKYLLWESCNLRGNQ